MKLNKVRSVVLAALLLKTMAVHADEADQAAQEESLELGIVKVLGDVIEDDFNTVTTDEMIEKLQASSWQDIYRQEPSITVGGGLPVAQKVYVRGLEDTLLNVSIDGATQAGYLYHHQGRISVEPELIKSVVVKAGAGNATDGAGALGGAIHIELKDAKDFVTNGQRAGGLVKAAYHTNNDLWKNHISAYGMLTEDFGILASYTNNDAGDNYEDGRGDEVAFTKIKQENIRFKLSGNVAEDHYLSLSYEKYTDEGTRFARPNMGVIPPHPVYPNVPVPQKLNRESWIAKYGYNPENPLIDLMTTLYQNDSYLTKRGDLWAIPPLFPPPFTYTDYYNGKQHGGGVKSIGFDIRNTSKIGAHEVVYGTEYRRDDAYFINSFVGLDDEKTKIFAAYAQADVVINQLFDVSAGLRYDHYDYEDNNGFDIRDDQFSPNATLNFNATDNLILHAGYAEAMKGVSSPETFFLEIPTFGSTLQSYSGPDTTSGNFDVGKLKAEKSNNIEIGFKYDTDRFAVSGEVFRQEVRNANIAANTTRFSYLDDVKSKGFALRAAYFWDEVTVNAGVSETRPRLGDEPLGSGEMGLGTAYGRTWTLGLTYTPNANWNMGWNSRLVEKLDFVQDGQDEKDGYDVHDIYVQWLPTEQVRVGLSVRNVFDKNYLDQGTFFTQNNTSDQFGLNEPGRDVRLSVSYQF